MHQSSVYREAHPKLFRHLLFLLRHDQNKETLSLRNHLYPADVPVPVFQVHSMQYSYAPANFLYAVKYKKAYLSVLQKHKFDCFVLNNERYTLDQILQHFL